jgi:pimeloyl-ACP methyl ester carboxylesterase
MNTALDSALEHRTLTVNGIELHTVLAGPADGPPVVLLHGFPEFWYGWRHQIGPLAAAGHRVIAPDLRGYNLSGKPARRRSYRPWVLQGDVLGLLKALEIERADLVGHDWGGLLAWWLALEHPQRLRRLVILNTPHPKVFRDTLKRRPGQQLRSGYLLLFQLPAAPELLLRTGDYFWMRQAMRRSSRPGTFSEADMARYVKAWAQPGALTAMLNWYRAARGDPTVVPRQSRVSVPTLMLWGERDLFLHRRMAADSVALCEQGRLERMPEATHWLQHEESERVNALIAEFLHPAS